MFLATDMLGELYGKPSQARGHARFTVLVLATVYMQIALAFTPTTDDFAQPHLEAIFGVLPRIALASMAAYLVSQLHDVGAFHFWKSRTGDSMLWLRNNASTLVSQLLDSSIFCVVAFWGVFPGRCCWRSCSPPTPSRASWPC